MATNKTNPKANQHHKRKSFRQHNRRRKVLLDAALPHSGTLTLQFPCVRHGLFLSFSDFSLFFQCVQSSTAPSQAWYLLSIPLGCCGWTTASGCKGTKLVLDCCSELTRTLESFKCLCGLSHGSLDSNSLCPSEAWHFHGCKFRQWSDMTLSKLAENCISVAVPAAIFLAPTSVSYICLLLPWRMRLVTNEFL